MEAQVFRKGRGTLSAPGEEGAPAGRSAGGPEDMEARDGPQSPGDHGQGAVPETPKGL